MLTLSPHFLVGYYFGTVDLGIIVARVSEYISSHGGFRFVMLKYYFSISCLKKYSDFILIDGSRKTIIYDLSLVVTIVVDSLSISIPVGFLVTSFKNSSSIQTHLDLLRIGSNTSHDLSRSVSRSMMTDEGSALVEVASSISGYYHYLCYFHINQLAVRVSF